MLGRGLCGGRVERDAQLVLAVDLGEAAREERVGERALGRLVDRHDRLGAGLEGEQQRLCGWGFLRRQIDESNINYLVGQMVFGDMTQAESLRSIALFANEVMPALR